MFSYFKCTILRDLGLIKTRTLVPLGEATIIWWNLSQLFRTKLWRKVELVFSTVKGEKRESKSFIIRWAIKVSHPMGVARGEDFGLSPPPNERLKFSSFDYRKLPKSPHISPDTNISNFFPGYATVAPLRSVTSEFVIFPVERKFLTFSWKLILDHIHLDVKSCKNARFTLTFSFPILKIV